MSRRSRTVRSATAVAAALVVALASPAWARPGDLDRTFDGDGSVHATFAQPGRFTDTAVGRDGSIVAVGSTTPRTGRPTGHLVRVLAGGHFDPRFGGDGRVVTPFPAVALSLRPSGRILAVGTYHDDFALARYLPDGGLDPSFGHRGVVTTDFGGTEVGSGLAVQSDGRIVAVGASVRADSDNDFAVARYLPDGSLDPSFGRDGTVITDAGGRDAAYDVAIQADGKIVALGSSETGGGAGTSIEATLIRYNRDGALDPSFGTHGVAFGFDSGCTCEDDFGLAVQPD